MCVHRDSNPNLMLGRHKYYPCTMNALSCYFKTRGSVRRPRLTKEKRLMPFSTGDSHFVPNSSTKPAQWCLTSQFWWDAVVSSWYDRKTITLKFLLCLFKYKCNCVKIWNNVSKFDAILGNRMKSGGDFILLMKWQGHPQRPDVLQYWGHVRKGRSASESMPQPRLKQRT